MSEEDSKRIAEDTKPEAQVTAGSLEAGLGATASDTNELETGKIKVTYKLRDINGAMVEAWQKIFGQTEYIGNGIEISQGDIFKGGPAADAIVSPANSFGFMDGGIDMAYSRHFGWQMQKRLQKVIREECDGEILVGQAVIIRTFEPGTPEASNDWSKFNEGEPIKYLISAPTMRTPQEVMDTVNAYLAFRAIILAVNKHNSLPDNEPIRSVLCPGLGTAVGAMPKDRCAFQMLRAYECHEQGQLDRLRYPENLTNVYFDEENMRIYPMK